MKAVMILALAHDQNVKTVGDQAVYRVIELGDERTLVILDLDAPADKVLDGVA
jgi:hypothetical protein